MLYLPSANNLAYMKVLLGISGTTQDSALNLVLTLTGQKTLNLTRQTEMPEELDAIVAEMAADAYKAGSNTGEVVGSVSSVSDNGQSVSYRDSAFAKSVAEVMKNHQLLLARWTIPGW